MLKGRKGLDKWIVFQIDQVGFQNRWIYPSCVKYNIINFLGQTYILPFSELNKIIK